MARRNNNIEENVIFFHLTLEQAEALCKYYNKDIKQLEEYEISELLDRFVVLGSSLIYIIVYGVSGHKVFLYINDRIISEVIVLLYPQPFTKYNINL